jgi:hypothetical protein
MPGYGKKMPKGKYDKMMEEKKKAAGGYGKGTK